jgi:hypothetical protein
LRAEDKEANLYHHGDISGAQEQPPSISATTNRILARQQHIITNRFPHFWFVVACSRSSSIFAPNPLSWVHAVSPRLPLVLAIARADLRSVSFMFFFLFLLQQTVILVSVVFSFCNNINLVP